MRSRKTAALAVILVAIVAVGGVLALNRDRLLVQSDVSTPSAPNGGPSSASNRAPEILSLTAASDRIQPFSISEIACEAVDPDGDALTYTWSVSAGDIFSEGPVLEWGSPVSQGLHRISVVVDDGRGGVAEHSISVRVKANAAPVISGIAAATDWVAAGESTLISCDVSDPDGDDITLTWTTTGGTVKGQGRSVTWTAPDTDGVYWIAVVARDQYEGEARRTFPISVSSGEPPSVVGLFLHGVNTNMLRKSGNDWRVFKGHTLNIVCAMADETAPFTYEWTADFGKLTADGATATWTAPSDRVAATIAVVVTDEKGNRATASVLIDVETCTCSF